uniref:Uncharacterized protein n=1 Tax=Timema genevievae TaxID=629358 RepID=A0A7R9PP37_TIMGE|nr:unnamed protein product [Timema genevievae]
MACDIVPRQESNSDFPFSESQAQSALWWLYTSNHCGFIEKIDAPPEVEDNGDDMDVENFPTFEQHLAQALDQRLSGDLSRDLVQILSVGHAPGDERRAGIEDRRVVRGRERDTSGPDTRRPGRYGSVMSRTVRNRGPRANRQMAPIENLIQDFIVNLTGVGWGTVTAGRGANGPVYAGSIAGHETKKPMVHHTPGTTAILGDETLLQWQRCRGILV